MLLEITNPSQMNQLIETAGTVYKRIKETEALLATAQAEFVKNGLNKSSVVKLIAEINKLAIPVSDVTFKNVKGMVTVSPVIIDSNLDSLVRPILSPLGSNF